MYVERRFPDFRGPAPKNTFMPTWSTHCPRHWNPGPRAVHRGAALIAVRERPRVCRKRMLRTRRVSRVEGRRSGWRQLVVGPVVVPTNGTQKGALAIALEA